MGTDHTTQTASPPTSFRAGAESQEMDSVAKPAEPRANRPLKILSEELGADPYNHTGPFSKPPTV